MIIRGNTVATNMLRADFDETDAGKSSFIRNKPDFANTAQTAEAAKKTADASLPKAGGTMTGDIAMGGNKVSGLATPTSGSDAANKDYVDGRKATASVTLSASGWSENRQTVSVPGVTVDNTVLVTPAPGSYVAYGEAVVYCSAQGSGTLTFTCGELPTADLTANVLIMN